MLINEQIKSKTSKEDKDKKKARHIAAHGKASGEQIERRRFLLASALLIGEPIKRRRQKYVDKDKSHSCSLASLMILHGVFLNKIRTLEFESISIF